MSPGQKLISFNKRWAATIRIDGTLAAKDMTGSIHQVAAQLENAPSMNGWTYWHYFEGDTPIPIDVLRQKMRAQAGGSPPGEPTSPI